MRGLVLVLLLMAGGAAAQTAPLPTQSAVTEEQREFFRICRAAVFYHLDEGATVVTVPKAMAETLRRQFSFIMHETLRSAPAANLLEAKESIDFAENFFLSFSMTLREQRHLQADVAARERVLIDCVPMLWNIAGQHIDRLMALRDAGTLR